MKKADIGTGIGLLFFSAWIFWYAGGYRKAGVYVYGPNFFPQILSAFMAICAVILIVKAVRGNVLLQTDFIDAKGFVRMILAIVMCILYLLLMQVLGFAISTFCFLFVMMMFLGQRGWIKRALSSAATAMIVWAIFRFFLIIPLPTGLWSFTF